MAGVAIPLILPDNCSWDEQTGEYTKYESKQRLSLNVVPRAVEMLRAIPGPICVVSIAGPCRKGKSYILSKAFDQGEIFPLGHLLDPETMGIWVWVVDRKFKDSTGKKFTVVLLDTEGIDSAVAKKNDDDRVFTLSVLLSSIMIYNSAGVPTRHDLENLDFIVNLSKRIHFHSGQPSNTEDAKMLHQAFPFFIWLLRDVVLQLPKECKDIREYFTKKVLVADKNNPSSQGANQAAESILKFFSGFDAFKLPPPSDDPEVVTRMNDDSVNHRISKRFLDDVQRFKNMLHSRLAPKKSFTDGEFVTGEGLAALVQLYVEALNTPGAVPNVQSAWETFVHNKCTEAMMTSLQVYKQEMTSRVQKLLPCENDIIRDMHLKALDICLAKFREETNGISAQSIDKYLCELTDKANASLSTVMKENNRRTEECCLGLLKQLKACRLDPVLARLRSKQGHQVKFAEITAAYTAIQQSFQKDARGAKDVCASVWFAFHPELQSEMEKHMTQLQALKDYDEQVAKEKAARAAQEEKRQKAEEDRARLEDEKRTKEKEFALMLEKQEEDKVRLQEQFDERMRQQSEQMKNIMEANQADLKQERETIIAQNKNMEDMIASWKDSIESKNNDIERLEGMVENLIEKLTPKEESSSSSCSIL